MNKIKIFLKDTLAVIVGGAIFAAGLCIFVNPYGILSGGATGAAMVLAHFIKIPLGTLIFLINLPLFAASAVICGRQFTLKTVWHSFLFSAVIDTFNAFIQIRYGGDKIVCALFGGMLMGVGMYVIFSRSAVTGGSDLLAYIIRMRRPHMSVPVLIMLTDTAVVLAGSLLQKDADIALYSAILIFVMTVTMDALLRGISAGNVFFILSKNSDKIKGTVLSKLSRGVTEFDVRGGYTGDDQRLIMCAVGKRQAGILRGLIYDIDPSAFVVCIDVSGVYGDGFIIPKKDDIF